MVTYIKIGTCDELKEWGKYDPIPATTECCCCGTTVIDIITPNKDKPIVVPDKPKDDTPTNPSDNGGSNNGNTNPTTPTNPSDNGNTGNTDNGNTTPNTPTEKPTVFNTITFQDLGDGYSTLFDLTVRGKVGETVVLGDAIQKEFGSDINGGRFNSDGNYEKDGIVYTSESIKPNLRDYVYTIKENGHSEEIEMKRTTNPSDNGNTGNTDTGTTQPTEQPTVTNNIVVKGKSDVIGSENRVLLTIPVKGKVGESIRVGDFITPELLAKNDVSLNDAGTVITSQLDTNLEIEITPNLKDYMYTIKEDGTEFVVQSIYHTIVH